MVPHTSQVKPPDEVWLLVVFWVGGGVGLGGTGVGVGGTGFGGVGVLGGGVGVTTDGGGTGAV